MTTPWLRCPAVGWMVTHSTPQIKGPIPTIRAGMAEDSMKKCTSRRTGASRRSQAASVRTGDPGRLRQLRDLWISAQLMHVCRSRSADPGAKQTPPSEWRLPLRNWTHQVGLGSDVSLPTAVGAWQLGERLLIDRRDCRVRLHLGSRRQDPAEQQNLSFLKATGRDASTIPW
jgi:hypothetical protein